MRILRRLVLPKRENSCSSYSWVLEPTCGITGYIGTVVGPSRRVIAYKCSVCGFAHFRNADSAYNMSTYHLTSEEVEVVRANVSRDLLGDEF